MKWAALTIWILTALGGFGLLAIWLQGGGMQQADRPGRRIRPRLVFSHALLAATGLVLWVIYLAGGTRAFAWAAFVLLILVAGFGFGMFALWLQGRQAGPVAGRQVGGIATAGAPLTAMVEGSLPAEQHFPLTVVAAHGVAAAATLVIVLLAALQVGG